MSNGNPFDELLYIQPGRHYGFPPAHPTYLTNVIDEPSVYDFGPQHQSTCGLNFNNPVNNGPVFGPAWWTDNAIVSGYSRGKIWRTELTKTAAGYVARTRQVASLNALTVDSCVSPQGDLVVSTHSGAPDWGSGPKGFGNLYKIRYSEPAAPQPVLTWCSNPSEIRIAFDRALTPETLRNLAKRTEVTQGRYVSAGDRFEAVRPGYAAVSSQLSQPRYDIPVEATALSADGRTLVLNTKPHSAGVNYSITFSGWNPTNSAASDTNMIQQFPDMELVADLAGVQADWTPQAADSGSNSSWHGWLPHMDLEVARRFTDGSTEHLAFWPKLKQPGLLELRGQLNLWEMLQPAIQPGSKLDYERPAEDVTVSFTAATQFKVNFENKTIESEAESGGRQRVFLRHQSQEEWLPFALSIASSQKPLDLKAVWFTAADSRPRAFPLRRFLLPWAQPEGSTNQIASSPEIAGGDWLEGRNTFFGATVNCQRCHTIRGEGQHVGPDLSNLIHRDYTSVLKDIQQPSAAINPDFVAYQIEPKEGEVVVGVLQTENQDQISVGDGNGHNLTLQKADIKSIKPSQISFMPEGMLAPLNARQIKNLMTFLLSCPLEPAQLEIGGAPAPRTQEAINELLQQKTAAALERNSLPASFNIVLCAGPKDHGPSEHDYPVGRTRRPP